MTIEEIRKFLANTKVYVNGKSKEIQEKLFSLGYMWDSGNKIVKFTNDPFIFIHKDKWFTRNSDMNNFVESEYAEILAEEILSLEIEPSYRPFKNGKECWNEMQKHQPVGGLIGKSSELPMIVQAILYNSIIMCDVQYTYGEVIRMLTFADGTPFGIKEE